MEFLEAAELFLWAEQLDYSCWFTGEWKRMWKVEHYLPRLVKKGILRTAWLDKRLIYTLKGRPNKDTYAVAHGLMSTKALLYFKQSKPCKFVSERFFRDAGFGAVPEFACLYDKSMILFEYSTADDFRRVYRMKKKIKQYKDNLEKIEDYFGKTAIVLFVFQAPPHRVKSFVNKYGRHHSFYFTDLDSFIDTPFQKQLSHPIYIWGGDGKKYPLE